MNLTYVGRHWCSCSISLRRWQVSAGDIPSALRAVCFAMAGADIGLAANRMVTAVAEKLDLLEQLHAKVPLFTPLPLNPNHSRPYIPDRGHLLGPNHFTDTLNPEPEPPDRKPKPFGLNPEPTCRRVSNLMSGVDVAHLAARWTK